jgi:hypothetical protein
MGMELAAKFLWILGGGIAAFRIRGSDVDSASFYPATTGITRNCTPIPCPNLSRKYFNCEGEDRSRPFGLTPRMQSRVLTKGARASFQGGKLVPGMEEAKIEVRDGPIRAVLCDARGVFWNVPRMRAAIGAETTGSRVLLGHTAALLIYYAC